MARNHVISRSAHKLAHRQAPGAFLAPFQPLAASLPFRFALAPQQLAFLEGVQPPHDQVGENLAFHDGKIHEALAVLVQDFGRYPPRTHLHEFLFASPLPLPFRPYRLRPPQHVTGDEGLAAMCPSSHLDNTLARLLVIPRSVDRARLSADGPQGSVGVTRKHRPPEEGKGVGRWALSSPAGCAIPLSSRHAQRT